MKKPGFTLIELIVSMSIIAMITAVFLVNYRTVTQRSDLRLTAQRVVADIRLTQNYALGLMSYGPETNKQAPTGGWGIVFKQNSREYFTFADVNESRFFEIGESEEAYGAIHHELPANFIISKIKIIQSSGSSATAPEVNIVFLPPDPKVYINDWEEARDVEIILQDSASGEEKTIRVNFLGLAEVLDAQ